MATRTAQAATNLADTAQHGTQRPARNLVLLAHAWWINRDGIGERSECEHRDKTKRDEQ